MKVYPYYICSRYHNKGKDCCKPHAIRANDVEKAVYSWFNNLAASPSLVRDLMKAISHKQDTNKDGELELRRILSSLAQRDSSRAEVLRSYERDEIDKTLTVELLANINNEKDTLLKRQAELMREMPAAPHHLSLKAVRHALSQLGKILAHSSPAQRRKALRSTIEKITLQDHRSPSIISVHLKGDFLQARQQEGRGTTWNTKNAQSTPVSARKNRRSTGTQ